MEHRQVETRHMMARRSPGDDPARFLQELRQLRDGAGLGPAELAARAHYPHDRIRAAEVGPALPDLPVLSAYVRGCGGTTEEWEERWRSLTSAPTLPLLAARPAGSSTAASAGARIGSTSPAADTPDPSIILAALDRVAEGMAVGNPAPLPSRPGVSTIEQHPAAAPAAPNSPAVKPGASKTAATAASAASVAPAAPGKPSVWETTTERSAWGTAAAPNSWDTDQSADAGVPAAVVADVPAARSPETASPAAGHPDVPLTRSPASRPTTAGETTASAEPATPKPAPANARASAPAHASGPTAASGQVAVRGSTGPALSRKTIAVLIALVICVILIALAIFA